MNVFPCIFQTSGRDATLLSRIYHVRKHHKLYHKPSCLRAALRAYPSEHLSPPKCLLRPTNYPIPLCCDFLERMFTKEAVHNLRPNQNFLSWLSRKASSENFYISFDTTLFLVSGRRRASDEKMYLNNFVWNTKLTMRYVYFVLNSVVYSLVSTDDDGDFVRFQKSFGRTKHFVFRGLWSVLSVRVL